LDDHGTSKNDDDEENEHLLGYDRKITTFDCGLTTPNSARWASATLSRIWTCIVNVFERGGENLHAPGEPPGGEILPKLSNPKRVIARESGVKGGITAFIAEE
jgi:hypothetical protein